MSYEVEMKFPLDDLAALEMRLLKLGATISPTCVEVDTYYNHPARDFAETDEALRVRCAATGNTITYKGPKIDAATKTRQEIDLPLPSGEAACELWPRLLKALGFVVAGEVRKRRRKAMIDWQGRRVEVSLDEVDHLGAFVELELIVEAAELDAARQCIAALASHLGLERSERRSYLELVLVLGEET
jgi:adenylate cyclase, class 2